LDCNFENGLSDYGRKKMMDEFDNKCFDNSYCKLDLKYSWFNQQCKSRIYFYAAASKYHTFAKDKGWTFWRRNAFVREPVLWGVVFCISDQINHPFSKKPIDMVKGDFIYFILAIDFICIALTIGMVFLLEHRFG